MQAIKTRLDQSTGLRNESDDRLAERFIILYIVRRDSLQHGSVRNVVAVWRLFDLRFLGDMQLHVYYYFGESSAASVRLLVDECC
jgi:hypothetical protein